MRKVDYHPDKLRNIIFLLIGFLIVFADQLTKAWIRTNLLVGHTLFDIGFLRIINITNTGAAFGIFKDQTFVLTIIACVGAIAIISCAFLARRYVPFVDNMLGKSALGLILGGTVGNLIDRIHFGYVTDFIDFKVWPTFNVADSAVTIGIIIFAYIILGAARTAKN